jgi:hypothetical protein
MYLIFDTIEEATERDMDEAKTRGCVAPTLYWWPMIVHPTDGRAALCVGDVVTTTTYPNATEDDPGDPVVTSSMPSVYAWMVTMDYSVEPPVQVANKYDADAELLALVESLTDDWSADLVDALPDE